MELKKTARIDLLKECMLSQPRYVGMEQTMIIIRTYQRHEQEPVILKRTCALRDALCKLEIGIEPQELIVGDWTKGVRYGVVFLESGISWVDQELETLPTRPQDKFLVHPEGVQTFREIIKPYWKGKSLEDVLKERYRKETSTLSTVVEVNQKDHTQGHICPNAREWLEKEPAGLKEEAQQHLLDCEEEQKSFYESILLVMDGVRRFLMRYHDELQRETKQHPDQKQGVIETAEVYKALSRRPAETFHEAVQSMWVLFVILYMESNASSFSPGRLDEILCPYYRKDRELGHLDAQRALDIIECLWPKFNQIVYLRNRNSAKYFAGFPISFNIAVGGQDVHGEDVCNEPSFLFLLAQEHIGLLQPNLSVRLHRGTGGALLKKATRVVVKGDGMPQFFSDEVIITELEELGISHQDTMDYAVVGCVELTTQGNGLDQSDAAIFNLNKVLELTPYHGRCLPTNQQLGPDLGGLDTYESYEELESAFDAMIGHFLQHMIPACEEVEKAHIGILPSPFLFSVIDDCMEQGVSVARGGTRYNLSDIQMTQVVNLADSLAAIRTLVYDRENVTGEALQYALEHNFAHDEMLRRCLLNEVDKYGSDVERMDMLGAKWTSAFRDKPCSFTNHRKGPYHTGMYTVSAHVPVGEHVGASTDGRLAGTPLADGGTSTICGRDLHGPTAILRSMSRLSYDCATSGGLLDMEFLPGFFQDEQGIDRLAGFLRAFVDLRIPHVQFNVVYKEDLLATQKHPEQYTSLAMRVAGYTAYFVELAQEPQNETIAGTNYEGIQQLCV